MARTTPIAVQGALGNDYTCGAPLTRPISIANLIVNQVVACAARRSKTVTTAYLFELETQLAAHYYTRTDRVYRSKSQDRASGTYVYNNKIPEPYLANAMELDFTGCLKTVLSGRTASVDWLGKDDPDKLDYDDRNA